ncbi:abortive phage infection protein [Corynebacterium sp.]|uniref:type IV toxin-antitoxin system AbiEi family antitoxin domain-containing protein n=1 Tax=Corynebacterium sp. TaxID=1720 RepID=UPI0026DD6950|nr:abortive phage infection protein [Corynebacterium sp.]MDO5077605.1 abortive phage infection protein [Corynebacterium sp.]
MSSAEILSKLMKSNAGIICTRDALATGVSAPTFLSFVRNQGLERVAHGVYAEPGIWIDDLWVLHRRVERLVFSHRTALYLHGIREREPERINVTVPTGYNATNLRGDGIEVFSVKKTAFELGRITVRTPEGNLVPAYDVERSICDVVRSRGHLEYHSLIESLEVYVQRPDKDLNQLVRYAEELRVWRVLKPYLEALL